MVLGLALLTANAQQTYVPDDNFEQALINLGYDNVLDDSVLTANISSVTLLDVNNKNISDITGVESFTSLELLNCWGNNFPFLDLTNLISLKELYCGSNPFTSIDLSSNSELEILQCNYNQITSLDLSYNYQLRILDCGASQLTALDLSNNTMLTDLVCAENPLQSLDLRNGNNLNMTKVVAVLNYDLSCISVDDSTIAAAIWVGQGFAFESQHYFSNNCNGTTSVSELEQGEKELVKVVNIIGEEVAVLKENQIYFYIYDDGTVVKQLKVK